MKTSKRFLALVLSALMIFSVVIIPGADLSLFGFEADAADITLGGITQQRVVADYESKYEEYRNRFFGGREFNQPTNFVIPGLSSTNDYTPQGMTYYAEKGWILISAYHAEDNTTKHSVIYAIDEATTNFVALFKLVNADNTPNTSHGGGIAASKYNFYYADSGSNISYIPLSEFDVAPGTVKEVKLRASINCGGELGGANTSYCCYEDGVLWAGNFYYAKDDKYKTEAHSTSPSMLVGYELHGNSSEEEWYYLSTNYNYLRVNNNGSISGTAGTGTTMTWSAAIHDGANAIISGNITHVTDLGEFCPNFGYAELTAGVTYKIEFISTNNLSDMYMFAPNGTHCNVKQSQNSKITKLSDGRYHYEMTFTAGLRPAGADSSWPTTLTTDGYTGRYTIRFDQDSITSSREFAITDASITVAGSEPQSFTPESKYEGIGCAGNPTHVITFPGIDKIQYAMVNKGKIYISRSWKRTYSSNHTRELMVGNLDITAPGNGNDTFNGRYRNYHILDLSAMKRFGGDHDADLSDMFYMGEALCVINDYLYMFAESAAYNYYGNGTNGGDGGDSCPEPIDVLWKIDQYAILGEARPAEYVTGVYYEKVTDIADIKDGEEYIIVYTADEKDPITQQNLLYALDSFGGYEGHKLPKKSTSELTLAKTGGSIGAIGYEFHDYTTGEENGKEAIYVSEETDKKRSIHWTLKKSGNGFHITNSDLYYGTHKYLAFNGDVIAISNKEAEVGILKNTATGKFQFYTNNNGTYCYLWCNDGRFNNDYTQFYKTNVTSGYLPNYNGAEEVNGTFHMYTSTTSASNLIGGLANNYSGFDIYRKVPDPYSTTTDTRVFTDMNAELQADGTYTVKLETYATSPVQYQTVAERPTDFIIAIDNSTSTSASDDKDNNFPGFHRHNSFDLEAAAGTTDAGSQTNKNSNSGTWGEYTGGNMWVQHEDGVMCKVNCKVQGDGRNDNWANYTYYQKVYLWYTHPNTGVNYYFHPNSDNTYGTWTTEETTYAQAMRIGGKGWDGGKGELNGRVVFSGVCYEKRNNSARLNNMQIAANQLIWNIEQNINKSGLDHRIAILQFSSPDGNSGIYTTNDNGLKQYGSISDANYKSALYSKSQFGNVKNIINNIQPSGGGTQPVVGINMATNIAKNSDASYFAEGNRSVCIIMLTDGASLTTTTANQAITAASNTKQTYGAYIYTIRVAESDFDVNGVDVSNALDYISSDFLFAKSLTNPGEKNVKPVDFSLSVQKFDSTTAVDNFVDDIYESVTSNSINALAKLNASSIISEKISDVFYTTEVKDINIKTYTAESYTDGLDRITFRAPVETTGVYVDKTKIKTENTITATGFDYTTNYVDSAHIGKKLIIEISGLLANPNYEFNNENITVHANTALYQNQNFFNNEAPIKYYPQKNFTIPEYTYVLDYGIGMLDTDVNGTLKSISQQPTKQSEYVGHLVANNVTMQVSNWLDLIYGLKPSISPADEKSGYDHSSGYCLIQRDDGTYDWFKINIKPASNVYFEEFIETKITNTSYADWDEEGTKKTGLYQTLTGEDTVYGYDSNYLGDTSEYSYGSAYKSQVDANNLRSETISFDYTGTAVDIVASCGVDTGIYIVTIKNNGTPEKAYIVDTYFTDSNVLDGVTQLNQVPIVHHENKYGYGTYTAEVTSVYLSSIVGGRSTYAMNRFGNDDVTFFSRDITEEAKEAILQFADMEYLLDTDVEVVFCDENSVLNGGTGVEGASGGMATFGLRGATATATKPLTNYFDGYRIYKPLGDNETAYVQTEQGSQYFNVVNSLATKDDIVNGTGASFVGYIVGNGTTDTNFETYKKNGPVNEVYLSSNNAIAFTAPEGYERVMISLRSVSGKPQAKIGTSYFPVTNSTEMYYDITDYIAEDGTVTIQNNGTGLLAVNNIKLVSGYTVQPQMMFAMPRIRMMMAAPAEEVEPNLPVETPDEGGSWPTDVPYVEPFPDAGEEPSTEPETPDANDGTEGEKNFIEQITENFTKLLNMIQSMLDKIVNLLKSIMA